MEKLRPETRNMVYLMLAQAVAAMVGIFGFRLMGGWLDIVEFGRYGFAVSSTLFFGLLAEFGIQTVATRAIACNPDRASAIYKHIALLRVLLASISVACLLLVSTLPPWQGETRLLLFAGLVAVTQFTCDPAICLVFGCGRIATGAGILIVDRLLYLVGLYTGAWLLPNAEGLLLGSLSANLVRMVVSDIWARCFLSHRIPRGWDFSIVKQLVCEGAAIGLTVMCFVAYGQATLQIVRANSSPESLGYYAIAFGIMNSLLVLPTAVTTAMFPALSIRFAKASSAEPQTELYEYVSRVNLVISIPIAAGLVGFPEQVVILWIGSRYAQSIELLPIFAFALPLLALGFMYRIFFFAMNRPGSEALINICGIVAIVSLGIPVCQTYGISGVAMLFCLTELGQTIAKSIVAGKSLGWPPFGSVLLRGVIAAASCVGLVQVMYASPWWIRGAAFVASLVLAMLVLDLLPRRWLMRALSFASRLILPSARRVVRGGATLLQKVSHSAARAIAPEVVVIGAGGHAKVVISTLEAAGWKVCGVFDDDEKRWGQSILGHQISGPVSTLAAKPGQSAVVAIGNPVVRARLAALLPLHWISAVHPSATVHASVVMGEGTLVFAGAVVQADAVLGSHTVINTAASVDHECRVGSFVNIGPGVHLAGNVRIGDSSDLGTGSVVIPGTAIGEAALIGAGSVVVREIPARVVALGCPAKVVRGRDMPVIAPPDARAA